MDKDYFKELLQRVRSIRAGERRIINFKKGMLNPLRGSPERVKSQ